VVWLEEDFQVFLAGSFTPYDLIFFLFSFPIIVDSLLAFFFFFSFGGFSVPLLCAASNPVEGRLSNPKPSSIHHGSPPWHLFLLCARAEIFPTLRRPLKSHGPSLIFPLPSAFFSLPTGLPFLSVQMDSAPFAQIVLFFVLKILRFFFSSVLFIRHHVSVIGRCSFTTYQPLDAMCVNLFFV